MRTHVEPKRALALAIASLLQTLSSASPSSRQTKAFMTTDVNIRHQPPDLDRSASIVFPRYRESALMVSPCHPERDGYFGGTSGIPVQFEFAFEMESSPTSDFRRALTMIKDHIIDNVVTDAFPQLCGVGRLLREKSDIDFPIVTHQNPSTVTGFRFGQTPQMDVAESCLPLLNNVNYCGIFKSKISVYGRNLHNDDAIQHIINVVLNSVNGMRVNVAPLGIMRLVPSEQMTRIIGEDFGFFDGGLGRSTNSLSRLALTGLIISSMMLITGILVLVYFLHAEKRRSIKTLTSCRGTRSRYATLRYLMSQERTDDSSGKTGFGSIYMEEFQDDSSIVERDPYEAEEDIIMHRRLVLD